MSDSEEDFGKELNVEQKAAILRCARQELDINVENPLLQDQLFRGYLVELEHGTKLKDWRANVTEDGIKKTLQIVWAHILEIPDYYDWLDKMEKEATAYWDTLKNKKGEREDKLELANHVARHLPVNDRKPLHRHRRRFCRFGDAL